MSGYRTAVVVCVCFLCAASLHAGGAPAVSASGYDWPRFRGPEGDGQATAEYVDLLGDLSGVSEKWSVDVGPGYSAPSVADGRLYTVGYGSGQDTVYCLDARSGKTVWTYSYQSVAGGYTGPLASPTVHNGYVYVLGKQGTLSKLESEKGSVVWQKNLVDDFGAVPPEWDIASSVFPYQGTLLVNVFESGMALDAETGDLIWASAPFASGYATPVVAELGGVTTALFFGARALFGVNPATGDVLWRYPWITAYDVNAADPLIADGGVFISSNYRRGCALIDINEDGPALRWETKAASSHFNSFVYADGYIYGNDGDAGSHRGSFVAIDVSDGSLAWSERATMGSLVAAGEKLIMLTERRELILAEMDGQAYGEINRISVGKKGLYWTAPVLADGMIFVRSMTGTLSAFGR